MPVLLRAKAHDLVVTGKNLHYEGSLTLGGMSRRWLGSTLWSTWRCITCPTGPPRHVCSTGRDGVVVLNGAAARLGEVDDAPTTAWRIPEGAGGHISEQQGEGGQAFIVASPRLYGG